MEKQKTSQKAVDIKDLKNQIDEAHKQTHINYDELQKSITYLKDLKKTLARIQLIEARASGSEKAAAIFQTVEKIEAK